MKKWTALLMLLPMVGFASMSYLGPLVMGGRLSFFDSNYIVSRYIGFDNYLRAFQDMDFIRSFANSGIYVAFIMPVVTVLSYWSASVLLDFQKKMRSVLKVILYVPSIAAGLAISLVWRWVFTRGGPGDWAAGIAVGWFSHPWTARAGIAVAVAFSSIGFYMIVFLCSLLAIPQEVRDAARIDGATRGQIRRYIERPMLAPAFALTTLLLSIAAFQIWETVYIISYGGPFGTTATPVFDFWRTAFEYGKHGYAAAKSILLLLLIAAAVWLKSRIEAAQS